MDTFEFKSLKSTDIAGVGASSAVTSDTLQPIFVNQKRTAIAQVTQTGTQGTNEITIQGSLTGGTNTFTTIHTVTNLAQNGVNHTVITLFPYMRCVVSAGSDANVAFQVTLGV
tara:strand:- start:1252 stop:1590 length:339 start_codon:yes stop_codon:yes gene_type:complete